VAKRNAGSFTYDGIDTGGERVAEEVEGKLEELAEAGSEITKISVVGYSLGGLIARYAVGLLFHRGVFEKIQPVVCASMILLQCLLTLPELHNLCDTTPRRTNTPQRLPQPHMERSGSANTLHERTAIVQRRQV
jgi:esterase/lipase